MKLESLTPILYTEDIEATIQFYTTHFNFVCNNYDEAVGWASLSNNDVELMISKPNAHIPFVKSNFTGSFYFKTKDVNALWNTVKDKLNILWKILITVCVNLPYMITMVICYSLGGKPNKFAEKMGLTEFNLYTAFTY